MRKNTVMGVLFLMIGIVIALFAIFIEYPANVETEERCSLPVTAVVVGDELESHGSGSDRRSFYVPVVKYEVNGQTYTTTTFHESNEHWKLGTEIDLLVDPELPIIFTYETQDLIDVDTDIPILTFVFAAFFMIFGIFIIKTGGHSDRKTGKDNPEIGNSMRQNFRLCTGKGQKFRRKGNGCG